MTRLLVKLNRDIQSLAFLSHSVLQMTQTVESRFGVKFMGCSVEPIHGKVPYVSHNRHNKYSVPLFGYPLCYLNHFDTTE